MILLSFEEIKYQSYLSSVDVLDFYLNAQNVYEISTFERKLNVSLSKSIQENNSDIYEDEFSNYLRKIGIKDKYSCN